MEPLTDPCSVVLPFLSSRKIQDPFDKGIVTYDFRVDTRQIPDLPPDANPRSPEAAEDRRVYKLVRNAALEDNLEPVTSGLFGYKNLGINVIAEKVEEVDSRTAKLYFKPGQGVLNGLHTLDILRELQTDPGEAEVPPNFVKLSVIVNFPEPAIAETAGANNSSVQVRPESLLNLHGDFEALKTELGVLADKIEWREGEEGEMSVAEVLASLTCMRSDRYPTSGPDKRMPVGTYERRFMLFEDFRKDLIGYNAIGKRMKEILELQDHIRMNPKKAYNDTGKRFGALKIVDSINTKPNGERRKNPLAPFTALVTGQKSDHRLNNAALYPILATFRMFMRRTDIPDPTPENPDNKKPAFEWAIPFDEIKAFWDSICVEIIDQTRLAAEGKGNNLNALGKDRTYWTSLQNFVRAEIGDRYPALAK